MRWSIVVLVVLLATNVLREPLRAQGAGTITGRVTSSVTNLPIPGARVVVDGTASSAVTAQNGRYTLAGIRAGTYRVNASAAGFGIQVAQGVVVTAGQTRTLDFTLERTGAVELEGVVAVGYGTQRARDITGAVGSVKMEDLDKVQVPTIAQALQGRVAGVQVTQTSSAPGGGVSIRIRGSGSIQAENEPLYVIDGVAISGSDLGNPSGSLRRGSTANPLAFLNPEDISSIEVLKDASSTAIYGARGTNGVVLITTKQGRAGTSRMEFESSVGMQTIAKMTEVLSPREWAEYANEWVRMEGEPVVPFADPAAVAAERGTDYQKYILQDAPIQDHNVRITGGTQQTRFSLSGNFSDQQGIVRNSAFRRYSLRANMQHELNSWLTLGTNLNLSRLNPKQGMSDAAGAEGNTGLIGKATKFNPLVPVYNEHGEYSLSGRDAPPELRALGYGGTAGSDNPATLIHEVTDAAEYDRILGNVFAETKLLEGVNLRLSGGANVVNNSRQEYFSGLTARAGPNNPGEAISGVVEQSHYVGEAILNFRRALGVHRVDGILGTTIERDERFNQQITNRSFPNDITKFYNIGAGTVEGGPSVSSGWSDWTLISYLGRANYTIADRYLFTLTGRADGSSKFGADNKWGFFPSGAFAWRASEEPFLAGASWLNDLKLRLSYGHTGNQEIGNYQSLARMGSAKYNHAGTLVPGYYPSSVANPELRWERSEQADAGLDLAVLDSRLTLTFDVYRKLTKDLLLQIPVSYESGFEDALVNLGSVKNEGVELSLGLDILDGADGGLGWRTSFNLARNRNEVVEIGGTQFFGERPFSDLKNEGGLVREGEPLGVFYGYRTDGLFRTQAEANAYVGPTGKPILPGAVAGQRKVLDVTGDGVVNADDRTILGNPEPEVTLGWSTDLTLGRFSLYTFLQGSYGNEIFNYNINDLAGGGLGGNIYKPAWVDRWTPENTDAKWPILNRPAGTGYTFGSSEDVYSHWIEDGSYLRLRSLTLNYDIPETWANRMGGMESARIFLNADNLITWTNYSGVNPDVNTMGQNNINRGVDLGAYPLAKTYRLGVRLGL